MRVHGLCVLAVAIVAATLGGKDALAQDFPNKPIRIIVPYAAGGGSDITTRIVQGKAMELLGQSLLVDNRAGGGTLIGTRMVQTASPDGYTLGVMDPAFIIQDGRLRGLAATSAKRLPAIPAVPTFAELGFPQVNVQTFAGLVAPAGTPKPVIQRLHAAFAGAVQTPEVKARLEQLNQFPVGNTPGEFATFLQDNMTRLVKVVRESNIKLD